LTADGGKRHSKNGGVSNLGSDFSLSNVKLQVYDIRGRKVATLINEKQKPGNYQVQFNGSNYPSGVYFYRILVGDYSEVKKMTLMK
jgi:hypothetical protein